MTAFTGAHVRSQSRTSSFPFATTIITLTFTCVHFFFSPIISLDKTFTLCGTQELGIVDPSRIIDGAGLPHCALGVAGCRVDCNTLWFEETPCLSTGWLIGVICVCINASSTFNHPLAGPSWRTHQKMTGVSLTFYTSTV